MPLSSESSWANSIARSSIMSPTRHSTLARSAGGRARQTPLSNDLRAAATARSPAPAPRRGVGGKVSTPPPPMPRRARPKVAPLVEAMGPPISTVDWSPRFVAQTLEVLPVALRDGRLVWMKPIHADSLRVGLSPAAKPVDAVLDVMKSYPLEPLVVHSTSWRQ